MVSVSRRAVLWIGFALVHVVVAVLGFRLPNQPMGDVYLVYEPWALQALSGGGIPGVTEQWIYPPVALVPMVLAVGLEWIAGYEVAWALLVTACDALAFALLVGHARSRGRSVGAWFWLAFILLLGPVGMYRLDGLTVPLAIAGCLWLVGRPAVASALLTIATWIKVWPAALLAAAVIAVRRRLSIITTALVASAAILLVVVLAGGAEHALGFVSGQTDRGLQLEAPVSMFYLWQAVAGVEGSYLYYDRNILTFQVTGPQVDGVIAVMTPLLMVALVAVAALGAVQLRRGARFAGLFPALALSLVLVFIVFNKVGSPQYLTWIIAPIVLGLVLDRNRWSPLAIGALVTAALTQIVYPITYNFLLNADVLAVAVLTARNLLLVALLVWTLIHVVRAPVHARAHAAATDTTP
ncbi:uncharacterized protein DUF2029 [Microbacterium sp. SLBN-146]|nr:uncharacterized protein DUF2029 [Microbacterium sp. SLBN-146]